MKSEEFSTAIIALLTFVLFVSCEKAVFETDASCRLTFVTVGSGGSVMPAAESFSRLNYMVYDADGFRVFDKVRSQSVGVDSFGVVDLSLQPGTYHILAVGHSSAASATISGPQDVRFTATDGQKLTDTWSYLGTINGTTSPTLLMQRVSAMFRLVITDSVPAEVRRLRFDYKGGSANFNPLTLQGITKSTQSEIRRIADNGTYNVYTFPYMAEECQLQMTVSALDALDNVIHERQFLNVPMRRNYVTTFRGDFFTADGDIDASVTSMGFAVGEWNIMYDFKF